MKSCLTEAQDAKMRGYAAAGLSVSQIAPLMGLSERQVRDLAYTRAIEIKRTPRRLTVADKLADAKARPLAPIDVFLRRSA